MWCSLPSSLRTGGNAGLIAQRDGIPLSVAAEVQNGTPCTAAESMRCAGNARQVFVEGAGCRPVATAYPDLVPEGFPPDTIPDEENPPPGVDIPDGTPYASSTTPLLLGAAAVLGVALVLMRKQPRANRRRR